MEPERKRKRGNQGGPRVRPEGERAPEPAPKLTDEDKAVIDAMSDDELFLTRPELDCVHISFRTDRESAARSLGWTLKKVKECLNKPHVKLYAIRFREDFIKEMVRREVTNSRKKGLTPTTVQERLMEIAMMPPSDTKGSVEGQVKALQELAAHLGLKKDDPLAGKTTEELQAIVNGAKAPTVN
jgi:hypothetical protein